MNRVVYSALTKIQGANSKQAREKFDHMGVPLCIPERNVWLHFSIEGFFKNYINYPTLLQGQGPPVRTTKV